MKRKINNFKWILLTLTFMLGVEIDYKAQSTFNDFVKEANFLKEGKMGGYYRQSGNEGPYNIRSSEFNFQITKVVKENGNVVSFDIDFEARPTMTMKPSDPVAPIFWTCTNNDFWHVICYKEHLIVLNDHPANNPNYSIKQWYKYNLGMKERVNAGIIGPQGKIVPPFSKEELDTFLKPFVSSRNDMKADQAAAAKKAAEEHFAKYSIKGKEVIKIEINAKYDTKIGQGSAFSYGISATLKDGSVIKTKNIGGEGYIEDYDIIVEGNLEAPYSGQIIGYKPTDHKGDYIYISVKSKYHPTLQKAEKKVVFTYNQPVTLNFTSIYTNRDGVSGPTVRVDVKVVTHSETKEELLEYRIYDETGNMTHKIRLKRDVMLKVISNGANAQDRQKDDVCGNGGDGGIITLNVDPKVGDNYQFEYSNIGGKGGVNKDSPLRSGIGGKDGRFTKTVKTIN
jgi:hypothetical protein